MILILVIYQVYHIFIIVLFVLFYIALFSPTAFASLFLSVSIDPINAVVKLPRPL